MKAIEEAGPVVDVLSDVVEAFRLRGSMSGIVSISPPWGFAVPRSDRAALLVVTRGRVSFEMEGVTRSALELAPGDVVAAPHGSACIVRDDPRTPVRAADEMSGSCPGFGTAPGGHTEFIGLCCELAGGRTNPVLRALPPLIHCPGSDGRVAHGLEPTIRLLAIESGGSTPGRTTVLNRLAEVVFIQLIRTWIAGSAPGERSWLRALNDPQLAGVLEAIHAKPAAPWTLAALAARARMSRSSFAGRFRDVVGETPMDYLTRWRVQRATQLLDSSDLPLKQIVASSGYASEAAFRTVFKRWVGESPGSYRDRVRPL
jgi:AraC-like DNA-binding protein